jgi:hypothetical protein
MNLREMQIGSSQRFPSPLTIHDLSFASQSLTPTLALRIIERLLANAHSTDPISLPLTLNIIRSSMERAAIIPDGNIIGRLPLEPHLQVMVIDQQPAKPLQQRLALQLRDPIDMTNVSADGEDALPPRNRIRTNDGMHGCEVAANVLRRATRLIVDCETATLSGFDESRLAESGSQALEELLIWRRDAIVDFISAGPQSISSRLWQVHKSQRRIVSGNWLKGDVRVPLAAVLLLRLCDDGQFSGVFVDLLVEFRVDGADLGVGDAVPFTLGVENRVDVET